MNALTLPKDVLTTANSLSIEGLVRTSCVGLVELALKAVPGVTEATTSLATKWAGVR